MDNLYIEIQTAMPDAAAFWMNNEVERIIGVNPEFVLTLGFEKVKELKSKLKILTENLPETVAVEFQDRGRWPHHVELVEISSSTSQQSESHLNLVFRNVISRLGSLLNEFDLIRVPKGHISSWERTDQKNFRYAINPGPDNLPKTKINDYWNLFNEYTSLSQKRDDICKAIDQAKAKELWSKA